MSKVRYPNIEAERARFGMTIADMVSMLGVKSRKTYYNWVARGRIPQEKLLIMADKFGCTVDYLLEERDLTA